LPQLQKHSNTLTLQNAFDMPAFFYTVTPATQTTGAGDAANLQHSTKQHHHHHQQQQQQRWH
jgi:hypothetical protein